MASHVDVTLNLTVPLYMTIEKTETGEYDFLTEAEEKNLEETVVPALLEELNKVSELQFEKGNSRCFTSYNYWGHGLELLDKELQKLIPYLDEKYGNEKYVIEVGYGYGSDYLSWFIKN